MEQYGNTSAASIPILLDEMNKKGMLQPGQKIILSGFGAGADLGCGADRVVEGKQRKKYGSNGNLNKKSSVALFLLRGYQVKVCSCFRMLKNKIRKMRNTIQ